MSDEPLSCQKCGNAGVILMRLHGDKGGPAMCVPWGTQWFARHGHRRRAARVVIRALKAYQAAGGSLNDNDLRELKLTAWDIPIAGYDEGLAEARDLTLELLDETISLTHPDKHPPERREEAARAIDDEAPEPIAEPSSRRARTDQLREIKSALSRQGPSGVSDAMNATILRASLICCGPARRCCYRVWLRASRQDNRLSR